MVRSKAFSCGVDTICLDCSREKVRLWRLAGNRKAGAESARYRKRHFAKARAHESKMHTNRKLGRQIKYTEWDNFFIEEIYDLAKLREKATGFKWHIDHIIPLQNKLVSGLHVPENLRVIPAKLNLIKGERF